MEDYISCSKCKDSISKFAFNRHFKSCKGIYKDLRNKNSSGNSNDFSNLYKELEENKFECCTCKKVYPKKGIYTHIWAKHFGENINKKRVRKNSFEDYNLKVKLGLVKKHLNGFTKAELLGLPKPIVSEEVRKKMSISSKGRVCSEETKRKISESMKTAVEEGRQKTYMAGRAKGKWVCNIKNEKFYLHGSWEERFGYFLNTNNILWSKPSAGYNYYDEKDERRKYFPDFYLEEFGIYIEIKGYETKRDKCKWRDFPKKLIILKEKELKEMSII